MILGVLAVTVTACTNPKEQEKKELEKRIMEVHDEVMPKMGPIQELQETLSKSIETELQDTGNIDSAYIEAAKGHLTALDEAHNAMMDWMAGYEPPSDEQSIDDVVSYLREQEVAVKKMAEQMNNGISNAEVFAKQNELEANQVNEEMHKHDSHDHHEEHMH